MAGEKRKTEPVPDGDRFMEGIPTGDIRAALDTERRSGGNLEAVLVLLACLWRRDGYTGADIAARLHEAPPTIHDWLAKMHRGGLDARRGKVWRGG